MEAPEGQQEPYLTPSSSRLAGIIIVRKKSSSSLSFYSLITNDIADMFSDKK